MIPQKRMPWFTDIAVHPLSPLGPLYASDRLHNPCGSCCPYCLASIDDWESDGQATCRECDIDFKVESSFGYGHTSRPNKCASGHLFVFTAQYEYKGENNRIHTCILCEETDFQKPNSTPLPWLDKYDDPGFFDPDGVLDTGRNIEDQVADRLHGPKTPVLDALFGDRDSWYEAPISTQWDNALQAMERSK